MASRKSDDEVAGGGKPQRSDPGAVARPGVYVQVAGTPRKKKSSSSYQALESGNHAVEETRPARTPSNTTRQNPGPLGMKSAPEPRSEPVPRSQSEAREKQPLPVETPLQQVHAKAARIVEVNDVSDGGYDPRSDWESENANDRADMVHESMPSPARSIPPERLSVPSVLDAKPRLHSDPPAPTRTPWGMIATVSVMSAIITAAGVVALQEWLHKGEVAPEVAAEPHAIPEPAKAAVAAPVAPPVLPAAQPVAAAAPEPTVAPSAEVTPVPAAPVPVAVPAIDAAPAGRTRAPRARTVPHVERTAEPARNPGDPALPIPDNPYGSDVPVAR